MPIFGCRRDGGYFGGAGVTFLVRPALEFSFDGMALSGWA